ncbi:GlxA family transcriptional regulator [Janthinobacterium agaricidamnosum]|uniref:Bacterial regulatory helix-turn-helix s, AraC family protein n=1 Tax=Janthinobacterium agaricidamnosum NBRC 102515 = DSM 9628 TaxID=1349767 RepID=W0VC16_9BURK|nr:GlxA family transcriptional regulator [Janthinobacterium agaricidamnosum]CDG84847.1 bacterial regulatory helix-turn-helix s, AraC family protein [Janthinobacterium agaricidamnosum NBRC 102515 = DSM 9628]
MQRIGFIATQNFQFMSFAALSVFEFANLVTGQPAYEIRVMSEHGGTMRSSMGVTIDTESLQNAGFDTLIIGGAVGAPPSSAALLDFLRASMPTVRRMASMCSGALVLADAGLLDGRRVTTHWYAARDLQKKFPHVTVEEDRIFIHDGPVWTSAGMSAGIDLALGMVEKDLGADVARLVAKNLVLHHRRAGGQSQHSVLLELSPRSDRIQSALQYAESHLGNALSVEELATQACLSPRQFSRAFRAETGQSPAKAIENLRLEAARLMIEQGSLGIDAVARETGFADPERMRRAFLRAFGQPPQVLRRNARIAAPA